MWDCNVSFSPYVPVLFFFFSFLLIQCVSATTGLQFAQRVSAVKHVTVAPEGSAHQQLLTY